ncbi:MAG: ROK family protein [Sedimentisphaerales bacterium]|nr:ROK family protein [Sedimentisphaerales bacterium]
MTDYFLGVDLGGTNVAIGLLDVDGTILAQNSIPTRVADGPESFVKRSCQACREMVTRADIDITKVKAVGIGSPGPLSVSKGRIIKAGNLPGFDNYPLRAEFSKQLNMPAWVDNDANAACWGEFWLGAGKKVTDMVMLTLGTGIGGGIIIEGEMIYGSQENGSELGHTIIQPGGRKCACGQLGCLEAIASASNTAARAKEALAEGRPSKMQDFLKTNPDLTCKDLFDFAIAGDELALEIVDGTARALAQICVNMLHITEPQMVVLTGGMILAGDFLLNQVKNHYHKMLWNLKTETMQITLATLGNNAGLIGAAGLALHAHQQNKLPPIGT